ncbi:AAA family ATPase [Candidatus Lokiarchaeum ossiferum]|uniref:AAA family ATPase n=1 Tax=Candidatus Lokiarchaeum ossiferum TaxID=2951803 RepID=UPI00352CA6F9
MIKSMRLKNFRKHLDYSLQLANEFNLIHGRNNAGKSTLFYAVEYCLFGTVQGFKKINQLVLYGQKTIGVELFFKGKDNRQYKLQRMHKISGRTNSAKGYFTLKELQPQENGMDGNIDEMYILSTDFGDREENLRLKLVELTGISKRFFEAGMFFKQGTISNILDGSKNLDVIFGITAASALAETFKNKINLLEKKTAGIGNIEILLNKLREDKQNNLAETLKLNTEINIFQSNVESLNKFKDGFSSILKHFLALQSILNEHEDLQHDKDNVQTKYETIQEKFLFILKDNHSLEDMDDKFHELKECAKAMNDEIENFDKKKHEIEQLTQQYKSKIMELELNQKNRNVLLDELTEQQEEFGDSCSIQQKLNQSEIKLSDNGAIEEKLNQKIDELALAEKKMESDIGNIGGILARRQKSSESPLCEYCGNSIDKNAVIKEIKNLENENLKLKQEKKEINLQIETLKDTKKTLLHENQSILLEKQKLSLKDTQLKKIHAQIAILDGNGNILSKLSEYAQIQDQNEKECSEIQRIIANKQIQSQQISAQMVQLKTQCDLAHDMNISLKQIGGEKEKVNQKIQENLDTLIESINQLKICFQSLKESDFLNKSERSDGLVQQFHNFQENEFSESFSPDIIFSESQEGLVAISTDPLDFLSIKKFTEKNVDLIKNLGSKLDTLLNVSHQELQKVNKKLIESQQNLMELDKEISHYNAKLINIQRILTLLSKYTTYKQIFEEIQNTIRENASKALEGKILNYHNCLSLESEFSKIQVDNTDYSLNVTPIDAGTDDIYPASVYQGGGHKLMLGLAYKFAIGDLIGNPPVLLIDEPTEFIDSENRENVLSHLHNITQHSQVLLITHQDVDKITSQQKIRIQT